MITIRPDRLSTDQALALAARVKAARFDDADTLLIAGSVATGHASPTSDVDVVVLYERVECARRLSFMYDGFAVDAFCHDLETINYFCWEVDRPSGVPMLPIMLSQGIELPPESPLTAIARATGEMVLAAGPLHLSTRDLDQRRASLASLSDDLVSARCDAERLASATCLYGLLADTELRFANAWSGHGKGLFLALERHDEDLARNYHAAFEALLARGDSAQVHKLVETFLDRSGGREVRRSESAPSNWRRPLEL